MDRSELDIEIYDIECFRSMFLYCGYNPKSGQKCQYEVSYRKNEIDRLIKHLIDRKWQYGVGYNCLSYDIQVLQYMMDNHDRWYEKPTDEILKLVYEFSQEVISLSNYELQPKYRESSLDIPQIDLFRVHHYDNKNRRVGLKNLEFSMDLPNIEEIPVDYHKEQITEQEIEMTIKYCHNDVEATTKFWYITIGECDHELYKGKDMIQARLDVIEELKFDNRCLNWSNSKIGDEINKKGYMQETGCSYNDLYEKKKKRKPTPQFTYGSCIPEYIKFNSKEFNDLKDKIYNVKVSMIKDDQEFVVKYGNTEYSIMRGGIHSHDSSRILETNDIHIVRDADIGGQYPRTIVKRNLYPSHLGAQWLVMYDKQGQKRTGYKKLAKDSVKYKGLSETWKDVLNAGGYGQTNQAQNWQYDPRVMYTCTIGNQFEILMLIEWLEDSGIPVVSANTDGIVCMIPRELEGKYNELCDQWEKVVGNDVIGKLEFTGYKKLVQRDVNNYMAIKMDGEVKTKGVFEIDKLLHKNKSKRIVPRALVEWYKSGKLPEETIAENNNIYDYVIGKKASKQYSYKGIDRSTGETNEYDQIVRYIVTTKGEKLMKVAKEGSEAKVKLSKCESNEPYQLLVNNIPEYKVLDDLAINRNYYIEEIYKIIGAIQPEIARARKIKAQGKLELW